MGKLTKIAAALGNPRTTICVDHPAVNPKTTFKKYFTKNIYLWRKFYKSNYLKLVWARKYAECATLGRAYRNI